MSCGRRRTTKSCGAGRGVTTGTIRGPGNGRVGWVLGTMGSKFAKDFIEVDLDGKGASTRVSGMFFADENQFFDLDQFESYRELGYRIGAKLCKDLQVERWPPSRPLTAEALLPALDEVVGGEGPGGGPWVASPPGPPAPYEPADGDAPCEPEHRGYRTDEAEDATLGARRALHFARHLVQQRRPPRAEQLEHVAPLGVHHRNLRHARREQLAQHVEAGVRRNQIHALRFHRIAAHRKSAAFFAENFGTDDSQYKAHQTALAALEAAPVVS